MKQNSILTQVEIAAARLNECRVNAGIWERQLQRLVGSMVSSNENGLRDWARKMGISAQYACDIRHGRRKISSAMIARIMNGGERRGRPRKETNR